MAPTVMYIDEVEKLFSKKKQKKDSAADDAENALRITKLYRRKLGQQLRAIKPGDRVLIIANSRNPMSHLLPNFILTSTVAPKALNFFASKVIYIPLPDYSSRYTLWKELISRHGGKVTDQLDLSTLCKISEGYSAGMVCSRVVCHWSLQIAQAINEAVTTSRLQVWQHNLWTHCNPVETETSDYNWFHSHLGQIPPFADEWWTVSGYQIRSQTHNKQKFQAKVSIKSLKNKDGEPKPRSTNAKKWNSQCTLPTWIKEIAGLKPA